MPCFAKHYEPTAIEACFQLYEQYKIGYWGIVQTILFLLSVILIITDVFGYIGSLDGESGSIGKFFGSVGALFWIGIILLIPSFFPGGFGLYNIYRCGITYLAFDLGSQDIYVIQGHWYNLTFKRIKVCAFIEFKGVAKQEKKANLLLLCKSKRRYPTDSLLLHTPTEKYGCFGGGGYNGRLIVLMDDISKYWMENCTEYMDLPDDPEKETPIFFGVTKKFTKPLHS